MLRQAREFLSQPTIFGANYKKKTDEEMEGERQGDERNSLTSIKSAAKEAQRDMIEKTNAKKKKSAKKEKVKGRTKKSGSLDATGGDSKISSSTSNLKVSKQFENVDTSVRSIARDDATTVTANTTLEDHQHEKRQLQRRRQNPSSSSGGSSSGYLSQTNGFVRTATTTANNDEISADNNNNNNNGGQTPPTVGDSSFYIMHNGRATTAAIQQQQQRLQRTSLDNRRAANQVGADQSGAVLSSLSHSIKPARWIGQQQQHQRLHGRHQHEQMMRAPMMVPMMIDDDDDDDDGDNGDGRDDDDRGVDGYDEGGGRVLAESRHNLKHEDDDEDDEDEVDEYGVSHQHLERRSLNYRLGQHLIDGPARDHYDKLSLVSSQDHRRFHHQHHHHQLRHNHNLDQHQQQRHPYQWREPQRSLSLAQSRSMMAMSLAASGGRNDCTMDSESGGEVGGLSKADENEVEEADEDNDDNQLDHNFDQRQHQRQNFKLANGNLARQSNEIQFVQSGQLDQHHHRRHFHHSYHHPLHELAQVQSRAGQISALAPTINRQQQHHHLSLNQRHLTTSAAAAAAAIYYQPDLISELQLQQHRNQRPKYQAQSSSTFLYHPQHQPQYANRKQHFLAGHNKPVPPVPPQSSQFHTFTNNSNNNTNSQLNQQPIFATTNASLNYSKSINQQQRRQSSRSRLENNSGSMMAMMQTSSSRQQLTSPDLHQSQHQHHQHSHNQLTPHHSSSASSSPHIRRNNKNASHQPITSGSQIISATKQNLRPVPSRSTPTPSIALGDQTGSLTLAEISNSNGNGSSNNNISNRSNDVGCCGKLAKFLLFIANALFWSAGIALGAWGILTLVDDHKYNLSQLLVFEPASRMSLFQLLSWSFITLGCATILVGFCGCSAMFKNSRWILGLYIFLILAIFALDLATGLLAIIFQERLVANVRLRLVNKLRNEYGIQASFTAAIDYIQTRFECCGLDGHFDYDQSLWRLQRLGGFEATVARTCCHLRNTFDDQAHVNPRPVNETMCQSTDVRFHQSYRYRRGCLDDLERLIRQKIWTFTIGCGAVGGIILLSLIFATCFCRSIPNSGSSKSPVSTASGSRVYQKQQQQAQQQAYSAAKRGSSKKNRKQLGHSTSKNYR